MVERAHSFRGWDTCCVRCHLVSYLFKRYWCMHELDLAMRQGRLVFPVYYGSPKDLPGERDEFINHFAEDEQVKQDELDRWWNNISRIPDMQHMRMSSFADTKDAEVSLKNTLVEKIRKLLEH